MRRTLAARLGVLLLAAVGCGEPGGATGGFHFSLALSAALADQVGEFQVVLLQAREVPACADLLAGPGAADGGSPLHCLELDPRVPVSAYVRLHDERGTRRAVRIPATTAAASGQTLQVTADVGVDYLVLIEALDRSSPPQLLGTSCTPLRELRQGSQSLVANDLVTYVPPSACDPRIDG